MIFQYPWNMCLFISDNTCGSDTTRRPSQLASTIPELNLLDFSLLEHLESFGVFNDLEVLQQRVENVCQESRVKPGIFDRVRTSVRRRAESCVEMHGNHTEHLLQRSRSHEHRTHLSKHWFLDIC
jgi:hypothetical protein